jgi:serine/threonine protein kinase
MTDKEVTEVVSFDGQHVWLNKTTALYEVGNFLGGGAAGTVYETEHVNSKEHFALKILTPLGYKLLSPALLRRCSVITKGRPVAEAVEQGAEPFAKDHVWWLMNGSTKQYLAAYYSERNGTLRELSLKQCMSIWGATPPGVTDEDDGDVEVLQTPGGSRVYVPSVPPKYVDFVRRRCRIFREIYNMRKISNHVNVIRLEDVLELTQETKCTIFLVMELANGGELFDRIKIDCGTREDTAVLFFKQLLDGVRHCHEGGVCHRDLKPENLLLQDSPGKPTVLKIADFGFSAWVAMAITDANWDGNAPQRLPEVQQQVYAAGTPPVRSVLGGAGQGQSSLTKSSPLRVLNSVVGSPFYVAPEVLQARGYDGYKADVWSLGVILYAMLAGNLPFGQELASCKRFRAYCRWVREMTSKDVCFYDNSTIEYPEWLFHSKFSPDSKNLIVSMLHPDPAERISVLDASCHPWCLRGMKVAAAAGQQQCSPVSQYNNIFNSNSNSQQGVSPAGVAMAPSAAVTIELPPSESMDCDDAISGTVSDAEGGGDKDDDDADAMMQVDDEYEIFTMDDDAGNSPSPSRPTPMLSPGGTSRRLPQTLFERAYTPPAAGDAPARAGGSRLPPHSALVAMSADKAVPAFMAVQTSTPPPHSTGPVPISKLVTNDDAAITKICVSSFQLSQSAPVATAWGSPLPPQFSLQQLVNESRPSDLFTEVVEEDYAEQAAPAFKVLNSTAPSFHNNVKRSTRFVTSVAASEVLEKIEQVLNHCKQGVVVSPVGRIGKVEIAYESYRLEVWGGDITGPALCSIRLYSLSASSAASLGITGTAASPAEGSAAAAPSPLTASLSPSPGGGLFLVEFVRGSLDIFAFKRFYDWLRQHVAELVKRDYGCSSLDFGSPA